MIRRAVSVRYRRFGWKFPHDLNIRAGYRGGVRK